MGHRHALKYARDKAQEAAAGKAAASVSRWALWVEPWLRDRFAEASKARSLSAELARWSWVHTFLVERRIRTPADVTYQHALDYMAWRQSQTKRSGKTPSHNTALQEVRFLGRILREAVRRGFIQASPLERMGLKRRKAPEKPELTDEDIRIVRAALKEKEGHLPLTERWMTISFEIGLHQGCRISETSLTLDRINEHAGTITFVQKGNREFTTRLHDKLRPLIAEIRAAGAERTCILPSKYTLRWHQFFKGRKEKDRNVPGLVERLSSPLITFHSTRVTVITRMARAGVPIQQAMAYVGHADETIHRIYQRLQAPDLERATAALSF